MADPFLMVSVPDARLTVDEYTYSPLPNTNSIRILHIETSEGCDARYHLESFPIENAPSFRALSYTWGSAYRDINVEDEAPELPPEFCASMICDGKRINITQNLSDALPISWLLVLMVGCGMMPFVSTKLISKNGVLRSSLWATSTHLPLRYSSDSACLAPELKT